MRSGSLLIFLALGLVITLAKCGNSTPSNGNGSSATQTGQICDPTQPNFAGGDGSIFSPYQISTFCHLYWFASNDSYWNAHVELAANVDLTNISFTPMITFAGTFDGQGYTISNWSGSNALIVVNNGTIKNVNMTNVNITPLGSARPALLVGTNMASGTINNCHVAGSVNGIVPSGLDMDNDIYWYVGGLASINAGTIQHSSAAVTLTGMMSIGGLVGQNQGGTIQTSSSSGSVSGNTAGTQCGLSTSQNCGVGGLVGSLWSGSIQNSYSSASVQGVDIAGGLVGAIGVQTNGTGAIVEQSFSYGPVAGTGSSIGGLVGINSSGTVSASYWDTTTSGQSTSPGGGTGEPTSAMQTASTYSGWDFSTIWNAPSGGYPVLQ